MAIYRQDVELKTQAHQMQAEGLQDDEPAVLEIIDFLHNEGFNASNIDISFDNVMQMWTWLADLEKLK